MRGLRLGFGVGVGGGIVSAYPSLIMDFVPTAGIEVERSSRTFDQLIDFTRTSSATYVDATGKIVPTPASRNLLTFTQEFDNAAWAKTNATITANSTAAPDGTFTADTLVANAGAGISPLLIQTGTTVTSSVYTASLFVRPGTHTFVQFYIGSQSADWCNFTLTGNGSVQNNGAAVGAISYNSSTGWYRISMVYTAGGVDRRPGLAIVPSGTATRVQTGTYAGTETIFIWGAQLEAVPDANLVLGSELRSTGTTGLNGTATAATYNTLTGEGSVTRVDISNQSFVSVGNLSPTATYRVAVTVSTGAILLRVGTSTGTALATLTAGTHTVYVVPTETLVFASSAGTSTFTLSSIREFTGTTGMPADYTRNNGGVYPPRFDYDPVTLAPRGLLVEEQRTNLLLRSEEFDNASWTKSRSTITANATTSPDGTVDADKLVEDTTATATHRVSQQASKSASSVTRTFSVYLKAAERTFAQVRVADNTEAVTAITNVDLSAGTVSVVSIAGGSSITAGSANITSAGNGWYRVSITATFDATITNPGAFVFLRDGTGNTTYTGNGTSGIFVWGAQWEDGAFATSYIPTVASQVTRTADVATITGANFSQWYNQSEGTFVVEYSRYQNVQFGIAFEAKEISTGSTANRIAMAPSSIADPRVQNLMGGSTVLDTVNTFAVLPANTVIKVATAYKSGDNAAVRNGGAPVTSTTTFATQSYTNLQIGQTNNTIYGGTAPFSINGHIRSLTYYNTRLPNAQLQALTT